MKSTIFHHNTEINKQFSRRRKNWKFRRKRLPYRSSLTYVRTGIIALTEKISDWLTILLLIISTRYLDSIMLKIMCNVFFWGLDTNINNIKYVILLVVTSSVRNTSNSICINNKKEDKIKLLFWTWIQTLTKQLFSQ